jgi:hypothetical protein
MELKGIKDDKIHFQLTTVYLLLKVDNNPDSYGYKVNLIGEEEKKILHQTCECQGYHEGTFDQQCPQVQ